MRIEYQGIVLRDMEEKDIGDWLRWRTVETAWGDWDAPWEPFAPIGEEAYRLRELDKLRKPRPDHRLRLEIDGPDGVHIGAVSAYRLDDDFNWSASSGGENDRRAKWALGIDICESARWSGGLGTRAFTAWVRYWLEAGYTDLYTQTWSGNARMVGLAEKLGFREYCRKAGLRQVRGGTYDGLTFRLDREAFAAHCRRLEAERLELYVPEVKDMWFAQQMYADPETMAYNAGWDVPSASYHPDTGCIDFPESQWGKKLAGSVGREPERFYAFLREKKTGKFVGEVDFHYTPSAGWHDMGVVVYAPCRRRGYGHEGLALLLRRAFLVCSVSRLHNSFEEERDPGLAIHLRAGFQVVGTSETVRFGRPVQVLELELTKEGYLARRQREKVEFPRK